MTQIPPLRNIAFVGHSSAGKTTFVDALAHYLGATDRKGSVADRTSLCDTEPEEQERGHTLHLSVVHAEKSGVLWNLMDSPGYPEFEAETREAIFAADWVIGVISMAGGIPHNFLRKMDLAKALGRPRAVLVTHPEAENVRYEDFVGLLQKHLGDTCVPVELPDMEGKQFKGCHRVVLDPKSPWRQRLMDRVMDACEDEGALSHYLETQTLSEEELKTHMPLAIAKNCLIPIMICDPSSGLGLDVVHDFLVRAGPTPLCHTGFFSQGQPIAADPDQDLLGVVFAVRSDPHVGRISLVRVLRGSLDAHDQICAVKDNAKPEKIGGLFHPIGGHKRTPVEKLLAGDIGALAKVEGLNVGDSFVRAGASAAPADFPKMPTPMVSLAISPKNRSDEQKIGPALHKLEAEDPTFRAFHDELTHELVVHGMSELHLSVMESRLKRRYGVEIESKHPRIAYRETIRKSAEGHYRHKKQSGGRGQFGECHLRVRPGQENSGVVFIDKIVGGAIPRNLIPAVEKGVRELAAGGISTHSKVVDIEVEVYDGKFHAVDSDEASFKIAGARALKDAFEKASPTLLEPIMELEIHVPNEHAGAIFSDLTSHRRGHVIDQTSEDDGHVTVITAKAPLATLLTYHRDLKAQTAGTGVWSMKPDHYASVPEAEARRVIAEVGRRHEED